MADGKNPLGRMWDEYAAFVKEVAPKATDAQKAEVDEELRSAKYRFDRWLADKDMYSGKELPTKDVAEWRKLYADVKVKKESAHKAIYPQLALLHKPVSEWHKLFAAAMKFFDADNEARALVSRMQAELKTHSDSMRSIGNAVARRRSRQRLRSAARRALSVDIPETLVADQLHRLVDAMGPANRWHYPDDRAIHTFLVLRGGGFLAAHDPDAAERPLAAGRADERGQLSVR